MSVSIQDVRHALNELGKLRFGEMRVEEAMHQIVQTTHAIFNVDGAGLMLADVALAPAPRRVTLAAAAPRVMGVGRPEMARLTLARKIAAIALTLWKKEERFDAEQLKPQAA